VKRLATLLAACALSAPVFAAESVAFVADLSGNASIEGDGKVTFLAELQTGTRLLLGSGSTVAVTYASTGSEFTARGPGEFVVELVGNELTLRPPAGGRQMLVPESPTVFYVTGQRLEFFLDASGRPTHFVLTIVEGDMKAVRKN